MRTYEGEEQCRKALLKKFDELDKVKCTKPNKKLKIIEVMIQIYKILFTE